MTVEQAIDYVYASYMKAEPYLDYSADDSGKRNPEFSREIIEELAEPYEAADGDSEAGKVGSGIPTVLVTGSKGKGSVSKMIAEIMGVHGKTGLMTSPHILKFNERIQVQGEPVSDKTLAQAIAAVRPKFDMVEAGLTMQEYISPMGIQAAAALQIFRTAGVQFQVMECGKGVAYDDVNNVPHPYAVINRIFLEHTRELGGTLGKIAENKAAIITGNQRAVFVSEQEPEVMAVLEKRAKEMQVPLYQYGRDFRAENIRYTKHGMCLDVVTARKCYKEIRIPLMGTYQAKNCALAVTLCEEVLENLQEPAMKAALANLEWPGRLEVLSSNPLMLLDACINRGSCANVLEALQQLGISKTVTIVGIPADKDFLGVAKAMQNVTEYMILTKSQNAHYKFGMEQVESLQQNGIQAEWTESIAEALEKARAYMHEVGNYDFPICILGTTSLISDVKILAGTPMALLT